MRHKCQWLFFCQKQDLELIQALADKVRTIVLCRPLLLAVDGLSSYVTAFRLSFRNKLPRWGGAKGRCKLVSWLDIAIVQVVKHRAGGALTVDRRIVQGGKEMVKRLIHITQKRKGVINTAYIERRNATFQQRLNNLVRRTRTLAHRSETLVTGMYIVVCFYNFCGFHHSLREKLWVGSYGYAGYNIHQPSQPGLLITNGHHLNYLPSRCHRPVRNHLLGTEDLLWLCSNWFKGGLHDYVKCDVT